MYPSSSRKSTDDYLEEQYPVASIYEYLLIALGICWFLLIVVDLYFGRNLIDVISFRIEDATWLPGNIGPSRALLGSHHFGDFQIWLGYAALHNPFASFVTYPPQSPPQLLWFFKVLLKLGFQSFFGIPKALLGFWLLCMSSWIYGLRYLVHKFLIQKSEVRLHIAVSLLSAPLIVTFDRGSLQFLVVASSLLFVRSVDTDRKIISVVFFVVAVSLKPYCAILLLWPLSKRQWWMTINSSLSICLVTFFSLIVIPGSFKIALQSFTKAISNHVSGPNMSWLSDSVSSPAALWKLAHLTHFQPLIDLIEMHSNLFLMTCGLVTLCAIGIIVMSGISNYRRSLIFLLSASQLIVPLSGLYTPLWTVAVLPLLVREVHLLKFNQGLERSAIQTCSALFSLFSIIALLPIPGSIMVGNYVFRNHALIAPLGMTLILIPLSGLVFFESLRARQLKTTTTVESTN